MGIKRNFTRQVTMNLEHKNFVLYLRVFFRYLEKAKTVSKRYRDQILTPTETMVYWSEYVIRHKGAPHLRSPGLDLNYIQYHNLDVFAAILGITVLLVYVVKWAINKICGAKTKKVKVDRNRNKKKLS